MLATKATLSWAMIANLVFRTQLDLLYLEGTTFNPSYLQDHDLCNYPILIMAPTHWCGGDVSSSSLALDYEAAPSVCLYLPPSAYGIRET